MDFYIHHIDDFIRETARLSDAQCMTYLKMIWSYYSGEEPLTDSHEVLAFRLGSDRNDVRMVLDAFFRLNEDGRRVHDQAEKQIRERKIKSDAAKEKARKRWVGVARPEVKAARRTDGHEKKQKRSTVQLIDVEKLVNDGLPEEMAHEWLSYRKQKRAPLTASAWDGIKAEAKKIDWSLRDVVGKCMARGWQGFEASWVEISSRGGNERAQFNKQEALELRNQDIADRFLEKMKRGNDET